MKIWLAYKFRGANFEELRSQLDTLTDLLQRRGHKVVTMIKDIQNWNTDSMTKSEAVRQAYGLYQKCDVALCIYPTLEVSEGRGWDAGFFAGTGKPTIMAIHESCSSPFTEALFSENPANKKFNLPAIIRYKDLEDIAEMMEG